MLFAIFFFYIIASLTISGIQFILWPDIEIHCTNNLFGDRVSVSWNFSFHYHFTSILQFTFCVSYSHISTSARAIEAAVAASLFPKLFGGKRQIKKFDFYLLARLLFPLEHHRWYQTIDRNADKHIPTVAGGSYRLVHSNMITHL